MFYKYSGALVIFFVVFLLSAVKARHVQHGKSKRKDASACQEALGMENGDIKDRQLSASSNWVAPPPRVGQPDWIYAAKYGRLNDRRLGSWTPASNSQNENQWLQVSFGHPYTKITRLATQGSSRWEEWVTSYKLQYSDDGQKFDYYIDQGQNTEKVFTGNTDQNSIVYHDLDPPIKAAYIRFRPITWEFRISLRVELYGCIECEAALGMENGDITDGQITASSEYDANHGPDRSRLNIQINGNKIGAWVSRTNDANQWVQVDLGNEYTKVKRVATQGRYNYEQWVKSYKLQYGHDGDNFDYYREGGQTTDKVFSGNTDQDTVITHDLNPLITAPYIRFRPVTWHNRIAMRVELYGCRAVLFERIPYRWKQCTTGLWESQTRLTEPNIPSLTWLQTPSVVQITTGHYQALGRVINARYLKERLTRKEPNFDVADRETMDLVEQLDILADTFYIEGVVELYGIRKLQIFARQIVASEGSKITVSTPNWNQEFDETSRTKFDGNGKDGEKGNDGEEGPEVNIFCDVINGAFEVTSNAADGHVGQNGGPGDDGLDNTPAVSDKTTDDCEAVGYDNCHDVTGAKGSKGKRGGNGGNAGVSGNGGTAGRVTLRYAKSSGTMQLKTCGGFGAPPAVNGVGGKGGEGGEGGRGAKCTTYSRRKWPVGKTKNGCEKHGDPLGRGPKGDTGDAGDDGTTPSIKGQNGVIDHSYVQSGTLDAASKQNFPKELLLVMRRQAEDLLLGNSKDKQGKSTLQFILSIANERSDLEQIKKDARRKLGFLNKEGYDIFGNNKLFAPLVKWGAIEENVEEIKNAAKTYENAINDIISTITDEENVQQMASTLADVSSKGIKSEIARLEESKKIDESEKRMYVEAIQMQEGRMYNILVTIQNMLPDVEKKVAEKLKRDELIATLQGITGFANAIAGKDPFEFIDTALGLAEYAVNQPCRSSLGSSLASIKKWLTFGKEYKPLEDSSDLDFDAIDVNSVPEIMQANLEISKENLVANLVCLLDEASKPSHTAQLEAEIESYFIVGSARVDMMAKCMDIDNQIGGYNFDIPLLKDTETSVAELKKSQSPSLSSDLRKRFIDNLLSTYRVLERSFMEKLYALHKALGFRTLWTLDDVMTSFRTIASESALGTGRLNGAVELAGVLQNIRDIKSKAVTCFTTNPYSTDVKKWTFDNIKNKAMFDELAANGKTTFSINIDRSCETCYNVRLLKIYIELFGTDEQPANVPAKIYLRIRHLSGSYFRSADTDQPIKPYRQPLGAYRTVKFNRFIISNEAKCQGGEGQCHTYCVTQDDPRWTSMCDHSLNKAKSDQRDSLMGIEECKSPFGSYELKIPKDSNMDCTAEDRITNTNCKDLDLTKLTKMNFWMSVFYWSDQYPKGPKDPICRSSSKKRNKIVFKTQ